MNPLHGNCHCEAGNYHQLGKSPTVMLSDVTGAGAVLEKGAHGQSSADICSHTEAVGNLG